MLLQALTSSKSSSAKSAGGQNQPVRSTSRRLHGLDRLEAAAQRRRFANLAGDDERAAGRAEPVLDRRDRAPTSRSDALKDLFSQIDANGDGKITKSEFENALGAGGTNLAQADDVFSKLDKDGDGSVSLDEMSSALKGGKGGHHHHITRRLASAANGSNSDPLMQALQGATSTSVTNSDGSTTTSLTYADGSKVTMTSPASGTLVERRDLVLQFHRADDPAPGQGDFVFGQPIALGQRLSALIRPSASFRC